MQLPQLLESYSGGTSLKRAKQPLQLSVGKVQGAGPQVALNR
jgi:hypothetical protein